MKLILCQILTLDEPGLERLFESFWAALDGRALNSLDRIAASTAFLKSLLECLSYLLGKLSKAKVDSSFFPLEVIASQISRVWKELGEPRLKIEHREAALFIARVFLAIEKQDLGIGKLTKFCSFCS